MKKFLPKVLIKSEFLRKSDVTIDQLDESGKVVLLSIYHSRLITNNLKKNLNEEISPALLHSSAVLNQIFDFVIDKYDNEINLNALAKADSYLEIKLNPENHARLWINYYQNFPLKDFVTISEIKSQLLQELFQNENLSKKSVNNLIILYLNNFNQALKDIKILFDDSDLRKSTSYEVAIDELEDFFRKEKPIIEPNRTLLDFLKEPIVKNPVNIEAQLKYIKENWRHILPLELLEGILKALDLVEEEKKLFQRFFGEAETKIPKFSVEELAGLGDKLKKELIDIPYIEPEKFTPDTDWMPRVVLLAKNIYVWLYQLSKKYNREIRRLDQIPEEELDLIASYNFNALWLIGIWERSSASQKIKKISGNPEALASAYSIYDYEISKDLGGEEAFQNLNHKCRIRGIRLACDIVPNHMGIYSKWIIEHADYFIQSEYSPFPNYTFNGPDLSDHPDFQIRIEDGYWTRRDAAVVFQLIENKTGRVRYIYHGNDGTNMPWNDTAQLNLLKDEVREALINLIFHVADKFSIIRLDAAMTLTQRHYQRLWFPLPGTGGAIPSRADFSMTAEEFYKLYPKEFWREVIDRINVKKPDTLLLAEAFWLLEGYFVRTLGMHRVYNSAFMNMLKKEENKKYRELVKNTLEFNPQILKRYVNFLSNPDEETAINQFGDGDKYFGCAMMMVTMPGLPMFAHGQVEGYREKYGHEYHRAYYDEQPNQYLIDRHKTEIFPLMKKRYMFSEVDDFQFFDFNDFNGGIIEDVFVYSNRRNDERALIFYNNSYSTYNGFVQISCPKNYGQSEGEKDLRTFNLGEALGLKKSDSYFYIFRELRTGMEYVLPGSVFYNSRFEVQLYGFEYKIFTDFVEIYDIDGTYQKLYNKVGKIGIKSIAEELFLLKIEKLLPNFINLFSYSKIKELQNSDDQTFLKLKQDFLRELNPLIDQVTKVIEFNGYSFLFGLKGIIENYRLTINHLKRFFEQNKRLKWVKELNEQQLVLFNDEVKSYDFLILVILSLIFNNGKQKDKISKVIFQLSQQLINSDEVIERENISLVIEVLSLSQNLLKENKEISLKDLLNSLLEAENTRKYLGVNEYNNDLYFVKEKYERMLGLLFNRILFEKIKSLLELNFASKLFQVELKKNIKNLVKDYMFLIEKSQVVNFKLTEMIRLISNPSKFSD